MSRDVGRRGADPALDSLFLPILNGRVPWPAQGRVLFLRARHGGVLHHRPLPGLICEQSFEPDAAALRRAGFAVSAATTEADASCELVLLMPPRQREEARALMARAVRAVAPGGRIIAAVANNEGARSAEADLMQLAGSLEVVTKHKCRVFWSEPWRAAADPELAARWLQLDVPRMIDGGRFVSRPGLFAWDRIDPASALLAAHLPDDLRGRAADLGAGFGYLSAELLARCQGVSALDVYEAEARALDLARRNLERYAPRVELRWFWHDVTGGVPHRYDVIVTNPPFHAQRGTDRPDIGRRFIACAAAALGAHGQLWLVANRHLPYESVLAEGFASVRTVAQERGFKVIAASKAAASADIP